jgi:GTP-binding protein
VDDYPGVTRDRNYGQATWEGRTFTVIDTGGFLSGNVTDLETQTRSQILAALGEADVILFVMDAKAGLHPEDQEIAKILRRTACPVLHVVNKVDGPEQTVHSGEFYELGLDHVHSISAAHGLGIGDLLSDIVESFPEPSNDLQEEAGNDIRITIVGRPNVGKSTLVNRILDAPRVIVSPVPGTTRDAVDSLLERDGQSYVLVDTAGIRRKGRTKEKLEKISVLKSLKSIEKSHVALLLTDVSEGITDQDLHIAGYIQERFRACLIGINKWDLMESDPKRIKQFMMDVKDRFRFLPYAPILTLSAMTGKRVSRILPTVQEIFTQYNQRINTSMVNQILEEAVSRHEPPYVGTRRLKFYYATQTSIRPPTFVLFCNRPDAIHFSYERYLTNFFREAARLQKTPIRLLLRGRKKSDAR